MKYIIVIDKEMKYPICLWDTYEHEDGTIGEDSRVIAANNIEEFCKKLKAHLTHEETRLYSEEEFSLIVGKLLGK